LEPDATGIPASREVALARTLAAAHDTLAAKLALLEIERDAGSMTAAQVAEQAAAAQVEYDRARALAEIQAETGWEAWVGVGGVLYARRRNSSPAKVVRAADAAGLRQQIETTQ
jgi:hypothetical protein